MCILEHAVDLEGRCGTDALPGGTGELDCQAKGGLGEKNKVLE